MKFFKLVLETELRQTWSINTKERQQSFKQGTTDFNLKLPHENLKEDRYRS